MGNVLPSDGIKSGTKINRECIKCQTLFESWSDDTMTIKGPMHPRKTCDKCNQEETDEFLKSNPFKGTIYDK